MRIEQTNAFSDLKACAAIWLEASIAAHTFIAPDFWARNHTAMLEEYLPASDVYVAKTQSTIVGFAAIHDCVLAALFVDPAEWGKGIGSELIRYTKDKYAKLELAVYTSNARALRFYRQHGFVLQEERICPHTGEPELLMSWYQQKPLHTSG